MAAMLRQNNSRITVTTKYIKYMLEHALLLEITDLFPSQVIPHGHLRGETFVKLHEIEHKLREKRDEIESRFAARCDQYYSEVHIAQKNAKKELNAVLDAFTFKIDEAYGKPGRDKSMRKAHQSQVGKFLEELAALLN